jgi:hypothetical protein
MRKTQNPLTDVALLRLYVYFRTTQSAVIALIWGIPIWKANSFLQKIPALNRLTARVLVQPMPQKF